MRGIGLFGTRDIEKVAMPRAVKSNVVDIKTKKPISKVKQPKQPAPADDAMYSRMAGSRGSTQQKQKQPSAGEDLVTNQAKMRAGAQNQNRQRQPKSQTEGPVLGPEQIPAWNPKSWGTGTKWGAGLGLGGLGSILAYNALKSPAPQPQPYPMY